MWLRSWSPRALPGSVVLAVTLLVGPGPLVASAETDNSAHIARVLELTNVERQKVGAPPLAVSNELSSAAQAYSVVLATSGCFAHTCGPVPDMVDRMTQAGYQGWTALAENIAAGYPTPEAVVDGWMSSPGHRANLLSASFSEIGIGIAASGAGYGTFWTQDFGARRALPAPADAAVPERESPADEPPTEGE
jgi:uncharacterized protein YkwD